MGPRKALRLVFQQEQGLKERMRDAHLQARKRRMQLHMRSSFASSSPGLPGAPALEHSRRRSSSRVLQSELSHHVTYYRTRSQNLTSSQKTPALHKQNFYLPNNLPNRKSSCAGSQTLLVPAAMGKVPRHSQVEGHTVAVAGLPFSNRYLRHFSQSLTHSPH